MEAVYSIKTHEYIVSKVDENDIDEAYETVREIVQDVPEEYYKNAMKKSVEQGYAWKVTKDGEVVGRLYIRRDVNHWLGSMIKGTDIIGMTLLWKEVWQEIGDKKVKFSPHQGQLREIKSIATKQSLRKFHNGQGYVVVRIKDLVDKIKYAYKVLGLDECPQS